MNKVLIWDAFPLKNVGGPSGYCYNIKQSLTEEQRENIAFLSDLIDVKVPTRLDPYTVLNCPTWLEKVFQPFLLRLRFLYAFIKGYTLPFSEVPKNLNLDEYDYVHLHYTLHTMRFRNTFPHYKGKVIVTSHQPCPWTDEYLEWFPRWMRLFRNTSIRLEAKGFEQADYIMFPCKEAKEPYEKNAILKKTLDKCEDKTFYVPSGIMDMAIDKSKMQKFADLGIPEDAFVVTYFGRHISVKGYDILKEVGRRLLDKYPNLYFLCAGRGEIEPLKHLRWMELGFISNAAELLEQSDLYILPNKDTYFDLVTLEILRSSTRLILSRTGGNRYFEGLPSEEIVGLDFFDIDDIDALISKVECHIRERRDAANVYSERAEANRRLFLKRFTTQEFVKGYLEQLEQIG